MTGTALALLAVLVLLGRAPPTQPPRRPPPGLPPGGRGGGLEAYIPTPPAVVARADELLASTPLGGETREADPTGRYPYVVYRAEWHAPSARIPRAHKGISVYHPHLRRE